MARSSKLQAASDIEGDLSATTPQAKQKPSDDPLVAWRRIARKTLVSVGLFSVFVNVLMMTLPIYLFQLSDRVLTSRSLDTLIMLSLVALGFLCVLSMLDVLRRQILGRLATNFEIVLGGPLIASIVTTAKVADSANMQPLRN